MRSFLAIENGVKQWVVESNITGGGSVMVYPDVGIALSTGSAWGSSIVNNSANWNTAYSWGDHAGLYLAVAGTAADSDKLDGQHGSYYAPLASPTFTGAPTVNHPGYFYAGRYSDTAGQGAIIGQSFALRNTYDSGNFYDFIIDMYDRVGAGGYTPKFTIKNGGNVGIGTTAPFSTLTIKDDLYKLGFEYRADAASRRWWVGTDYSAYGDFFISTESTKGNSSPGLFRFYISPTGNVGIGTTTPGSALSINGGVHIGGDSDAGDNNLIVDGTSLMTGIATFSDDLGSGSFTSGFVGSGWKLDYNTDSSLTVDNLTVRKKMRVYELEINKINSVNGGIMVSVANGKVYSVSTNAISELNAWTNSSFETFTSSGLEITSAINSSGVGTANLPNYTTVVDEVITIVCTLTLNSGAAPRIFIGSDNYLLSAGVNTITHTVTSAGSTAFSIQTGASASDFALSSVSFSSNIQKIYFDEDESTAGTGNIIQFEANDYIRAQEWTGRGVDSYTGKVISVNHSATLGSAYIRAMSTDVCWTGAELVQVGNTTEADRQNMIYITAADTNNPYIQMVTGVTDGNFAGHTKVMLGNLAPIASTGIVPASPGFGLFCDNVYLTGKIILPTAGMTDEGSSASDIRIYAGDTYANRATAPFRIQQNGKGVIAGWTLDTNVLQATVGSYDCKLRASDGVFMWMGIEFYNYSQQSTPVTLSTSQRYMYVCLDNNAESTLNLPGSGLPGGGSSTILIINHKYGTGLGAAKYHIQGNGYNIINAGSSASSIDLDEGHTMMLVWEPRGTSWYVVSIN